jgi:hypothetical protein
VPKIGWSPMRLFLSKCLYCCRPWAMGGGAAVGPRMLFLFELFRQNCKAVILGGQGHLECFRNASANITYMSIEQSSTLK